MTIGGITDIIIGILAEEKSYNVPQICIKYNLCEGTADEAFNSKRLYIGRRLKGKSNLFILDMAERVAKDYNSKELRRAISQYKDMQKYEINGNIRRALLDELYSIDEQLEGELSIIPFLNRIWNLSKIPSPYGGDGTMRDSVYQHMVKNDDWSYNDLFDSYLDLVGADDSIFEKFLESLVNPVVRKGNKQRTMVTMINSHIVEDGYELIEHGSNLGIPVYKLMNITTGVEGQVKNIIFAAVGPKPELVFTDAVNNDISVVKNEENCLIFDKAIPEIGLKWVDLVSWWETSNYHKRGEENLDRELFLRLKKTLDKGIESDFFTKYYIIFRKVLGDELPALIPQVYLHYDPKTMAQLKGQKRLERQRMDFLMLLSDRHRIVIEIDGKQHYSKGDKASPTLYSSMVAEDRRMKLAGYDLYRFGGYELTYGNMDKLIEEFFKKLFRKYSVK